MTFIMIGTQEGFRISQSLLDQVDPPSQSLRINNGRIHPLTSLRRMRMTGISRKQHPMPGKVTPFSV